MIFKSFDLLRAAGFDNVNLDLMFAIPGQTMAMWRATLAEAVALGSEHLACYEVIYEEDTAVVRPVAGRQNRAPTKIWPARCTTNFWRRRTRRAWSSTKWPTLRGGGGRGELPERACRHNVNYWRGGWFHGLGPSAAGYAGGRRTANIANTTLYCEQLERGVRPVASSEEVAAAGAGGGIGGFWVAHDGGLAAGAIPAAHRL